LDPDTNSSRPVKPTGEPAGDEVTNLLRSWRRGDSAAGERLLEAVYDDLHRQAARAMHREASGHSLQATALVHEAYLRLVDQRHVDWNNRAHFFAIAAQAMRRVLVDHARGRLAAKRGGAAQQITLDDGVLAGETGDSHAVEVLALHDALERLTAIDPEQARIVELRYFAGSSIEETAAALGVSPATVKREWAVARAWLRRELSEA
jgi:RNA polymerase sigma-70 factor, ECF subfamily